jgi:hypothetical protein
MTRKLRSLLFPTCSWCIPSFLSAAAACRLLLLECFCRSVWHFTASFSKSLPCVSLCIHASLCLCDDVLHACVACFAFLSTVGDLSCFSPSLRLCVLSFLRLELLFVCAVFSHCLHHCHLDASVRCRTCSRCIQIAHSMLSSRIFSYTPSAPITDSLAGGQHCSVCL